MYNAFLRPCSEVSGCQHHDKAIYNLSEALYYLFDHYPGEDERCQETDGGDALEEKLSASEYNPCNLDQEMTDEEESNDD